MSPAPIVSTGCSFRKAGSIEILAAPELGEHSVFASVETSIIFSARTNGFDVSRLIIEICGTFQYNNKVRT